MDRWVSVLQYFCPADSDSVFKNLMAMLWHSYWNCSQNFGAKLLICFPSFPSKLYLKCQLLDDVIFWFAADKTSSPLFSAKRFELSPNEELKFFHVYFETKQNIVFAESNRAPLSGPGTSCLSSVGALLIYAKQCRCGPAVNRGQSRENSSQII